MKIFLTIQNYRCFPDPAKIEIDKGFTAFVGLNNAGKSAIMRFLLEFRGLLKLIAGTGNFLNSLQADSNQTFNPEQILDKLEVFSNLNDNKITFWLDFVYDDPTPEGSSRLTKALFKVGRDFRWRSELTVDGTVLEVNSRTSFVGTILQIRGGNVVDLVDLINVAKSLSDTLYIGPFRNAINTGTNENYLDMKVGESFIRELRELKAGNNKQANISISRITEDIKHIFGFDQLDIGPASDNKTLHIDINGNPYKQHELGSGLTQFILVLANASVRRPAYVLIDEPELNLHPSLQLNFLTSLGKYAKEGVWFSTHSIGLARSGGDHVYSVIQESEGRSKVRPLEGTPRISEFLGEMSFSSHKELGFEKVLIVEGPTDIKVFQVFLRKISKDHKVVIISLSGRVSGAYQEELEELMRITTNVSVIVDSEKISEDADLEQGRKDFVELCKTMKIPCLVTKYRATENYFPDPTIKAIFGPEYRALGPYEKLGDVEPHWSKAQNWRLADAMSLEDLNKTDIGKFMGKL